MVTKRGEYNTAQNEGQCRAKNEGGARQAHTLANRSLANLAPAVRMPTSIKIQHLHQL